MKLGSLFSGGGLGDFGFMAAGMDITWQCEIDEYCQKILALRYPESKKYRDIKTLKGGELEHVDILTGGFPCQPFSVAGKQKGKLDERFLWPEMLRLCAELRPRWIIVENVLGIVNLALESICSDLEAEGYEVWTLAFPSHALGAWHKRDRVWIICNAKHNGQLASKEHGSIKEGIHYISKREEQSGQPAGPSRQCSFMANTNILQNKKTKTIYNIWQKYWEAEPRMGRMVNGDASTIHRLKMLGNGQVPACTYVIGKMIMEIEGK